MCEVAKVACIFIVPVDWTLTLMHKIRLLNTYNRKEGYLKLQLGLGGETRFKTIDIHCLHDVWIFSHFVIIFHLSKPSISI